MPIKQRSSSRNYEITLYYKGKEYVFQGYLYWSTEVTETWYIRGKNKLLVVTFKPATGEIKEQDPGPIPAPDDFLSALKQELQERSNSSPKS